MSRATQELQSIPFRHLIGARRAGRFERLYLGRLCPRWIGVHAMTNGEKLNRQLIVTLDGVAQGLDRLRQVVEASGFGEALPGYRQMKTVLLQQRMWSLANPAPGLDQAWQGVERSARSAHDLLAPFCAVLDEITRVATLGGGVAGQVAVLEETAAAAIETTKKKKRGRPGPKSKQTPQGNSRG